jgi:hypothetical protein
LQYRKFSEKEKTWPETHQVGSRVNAQRKSTSPKLLWTKIEFLPQMTK